MATHCCCVWIVAMSQAIRAFHTALQRAPRSQHAPEPEPKPDPASPLTKGPAESSRQRRYRSPAEEIPLVGRVGSTVGASPASCEISEPDASRKLVVPRVAGDVDPWASAQACRLKVLAQEHTQRYEHE